MKLRPPPNVVGKLRLVHGILTEAECAAALEVVARLTWSMPPPPRPGIPRTNSRAKLTDLDLARRAGERLKIPLSQHFFAYRYKAGEEFGWHVDSQMSSPDAVPGRTPISVLIYLNECAGGHTEFDDIAVQPRPGTALLIPHGLRHRARAPISGVKYALRTDGYLLIHPPQKDDQGHGTHHRS